MKITRIITLFIVAIISITQVEAQINSIGHRTITFNDPSRTGGTGSGGGTGRQIQTEVYYPSSAATDGDSTAITAGQYPILIFGHGFVMAWSSYDNVWKDLVPQGYIICFPRTEGGASPSHTDFGKDLALIQTKMLALNANSASVFFNTMIPKVAIMGHSMGGGSAFLACSNNTAPTTMVTFAAATTNPSSVAAAQQVTIPTLVIAGQNDCVAPPAKNQDSMYMMCAASCKAEVTIIGAAHCEFANSSFTCSFGESTCSPAPTISATKQQNIASTYYSPWLKYWLKNDCNAWNTFLDSLNNSTSITKNLSCSQTCTTAGIEQYSNQSIKIAPNPASSVLNVTLPNNDKYFIETYDAIGNKIDAIVVEGKKDLSLDLNRYDKGVYFIVCTSALHGTKHAKFIKE